MIPALPPNLKTPRPIAVLSLGHFLSIENYLLYHGFPFREVSLTTLGCLTPDHVLIIPPSALYGIAGHDPALSEFLDSFTQQGGVVLMFSQPFGTAMELSPPGSPQLEAYGFREDQVCSQRPIISSIHPLNTGFNNFSWAFITDGYVEHIPVNALNLIRRRSNEKPVWIIYPNGNGYINLITLFNQNRRRVWPNIILNNLILWTMDEDKEIPWPSVEETSIHMEVPVINLSETTTQRIRFFTRYIIDQRIWESDGPALEITLQPGERQVIPVNLTFAAIAQGLVSVFYTLERIKEDGTEEVVFTALAPATFAHGNVTLGSSSPRVHMWVTTDDETYPQDSPVHFQIHLKNNTPFPVENMKIAVYKRASGQYCSVTTPFVGVLPETINLGPGEGRIIEWEDILRLNYDYYFYLIPSDADLSACIPNKDVSVTCASALNSNQRAYSRRDLRIIWVRTENLVSIENFPTEPIKFPISETPPPLEYQVKLNSSLSKTVLLHWDISTSWVNYEGIDDIITLQPGINSFQHTFPQCQGFDKCRLRLTIYSILYTCPNGYSKDRSDWAEGSYIGIRPSIDLEFQWNLTFGAPSALPVKVSSIGEIPLLNGNLHITLFDPDDQIVAQGQWALPELPPGDEVIVTLPVDTSQHPLGRYKFCYSLTGRDYEKYDCFFYNFSVDSNFFLNPPSDPEGYSSGETVSGHIHIHSTLGSNSMVGTVQLQDSLNGVILNQPFTLTESQPFLFIPFSFTIPPSMGGEQTLKLTVSTGSSSVVTSQTYFIRYPSYEVVGPSGIITAGQDIPLLIHNTGGSHAQSQIHIELFNLLGSIIYQDDRTASIPVNTTYTLLVPTTPDLFSGQYHVRVMINDQSTRTYESDVDVSLSGVQLTLTSQSDQPLYSRGNPVQVLTQLINGGVPIPSATLNITITGFPPLEAQWEPFPQKLRAIDSFTNGQTFLLLSPWALSSTTDFQNWQDIPLSPEWINNDSLGGPWWGTSSLAWGINHGAVVWMNSSTGEYFVDVLDDIGNILSRLTLPSTLGSNGKLVLDGTDTIWVGDRKQEWGTPNPYYRWDGASWQSLTFPSYVLAWATDTSGAWFGTEADGLFRWTPSGGLVQYNDFTDPDLPGGKIMKVLAQPWSSQVWIEYEKAIGGNPVHRWSRFDGSVWTSYPVPPPYDTLIPDDYVFVGLQSNRVVLYRETVNPNPDISWNHVLEGFDGQTLTPFVSLPSKAVGNEVPFLVDTEQRGKQYRYDGQVLWHQNSWILPLFGVNQYFSASLNDVIGWIQWDYDSQSWQVHLNRSGEPGFLGDFPVQGPDGALWTMAPAENGGYLTRYSPETGSWSVFQGPCPHAFHFGPAPINGLLWTPSFTRLIRHNNQLVLATDFRSEPHCSLYPNAMGRKIVTFDGSQWSTWVDLEPILNTFCPNCQIMDFAIDSTSSIWVRLYDNWPYLLHWTPNGWEYFDVLSLPANPHLGCGVVPGPNNTFYFCAYAGYPIQGRSVFPDSNNPLNPPHAFLKEEKTGNPRLRPLPSPNATGGILQSDGPFSGILQWDGTNWIFIDQFHGISLNPLDTLMYDPTEQAWGWSSTQSGGAFANHLSPPSAPTSSSTLYKTTDAQTVPLLNDFEYGYQITATPFGWILTQPLMLIDPVDGTIRYRADQANVQAWNLIEHFDVVGPTVWTPVGRLTLSTPGGGIPQSQVLWSTQHTVQLDSGQTLSFDDGTSPWNLTGLFRVQASLELPSGTIQSTPTYFQVVPAALSLNLQLPPEPSTYRTGDPVSFTFVATNTGPSVLTQVHLLVESVHEDVHDPLLDTVVDIPPGQTISWNLQTPAVPGMVLLAQTQYSANGQPIVYPVMLDVNVQTPALESTWDVPPVTGNLPFSTTLSLTNPTDLTLNLQMEFLPQPMDNIPSQLTLAPQSSQSFTLRYDPTDLVFQPNATLQVSITGDFTTSLTSTVQAAPSPTFQWESLPPYPGEGNITLPFTLSNPAAMLQSGTLTVTLQPSGPQFQRSYLLEPNANLQDSFSLSLSAGTYTVSTTWNGQNLPPWSFTVYPLDQTDILVFQFTDLNPTSAVIHLVIQNNGLQSWSGRLVSATTILHLDENIFVDPLSTLDQSYTAPIAFPGVGSFPIPVQLIYGNTTQQIEQTLTIPPPHCHAADIQTNPQRAGQAIIIDITWTITNDGGDLTDCELLVQPPTQSPTSLRKTLAPGESFTDHTLLVFPSMDPGISRLDIPWQLAHVQLSQQSTIDEQDTITLPLPSSQLVVLNAALDRSYYEPGETFHLTLTLALEPPPSYPINFIVESSYGSEAHKEEIALLTSATVDFSFQAESYDVVNYRITAEDSDLIRIIEFLQVPVVESTPIVLGPSRTIPAGTTAQLWAFTREQGLLTLTFPNQDNQFFNLTQGVTPIAFPIPYDLPTDTYSLKWSFTGQDTGFTSEGQTPIPVQGIEFSTLFQEFDRSVYLPGESARFSITQTATLDFTGTLRWHIEDVEGKRITEHETQPLTLPAGQPVTSAYTFTVPSHPGRHRLVMTILNPSGNPVRRIGYMFNIGGVDFLGLRTEPGEYPDRSSPLVAVATLWGSVPVQLDAYLNDTYIMTVTASLHDITSIPITLGSPAPGQYKLKIILTSDSGSMERSLSITYGRDLPDLTIQSVTPTWNAPPSPDSCSCIERFDIQIQNIGRRTASTYLIRAQESHTGISREILGPVIQGGQSLTVPLELHLCFEPEEDSMWTFSLIPQADLDEWNLENNALTWNNTACRPNLDCSQAQAYPNILLEPNHLFVPIFIKGITFKGADPANLTIQAIEVRQDEPVVGQGTGNFAPDAILDPLQIRAERSGVEPTGFEGNGRVYHISFVASDNEGHSCSREVTVCVPPNHDTPSCIDEGPIYDSTQQP